MAGSMNPRYTAVHTQVQNDIVVPVDGVVPVDAVDTVDGVDPVD